MALDKNKPYGDVEAEVEKVAAWLAHNPGEVTALVNAMLLKNIFELAHKNQA